MKGTLILFLSTGIFAIISGCQKEDDKSIIKDIDGNKYKTVTIGQQVWTAENLKTTRFNDGTQIPNVIADVQWGSLTTPAYCWYNNDESYKDIYGALYNWYAVNTGKLCPKGWHVPSQKEWETLRNFLGGYSGSGNKLKEAGLKHWKTTTSNVTNESGFTALPAGVRSAGALFLYMGTQAAFWTSTEYDEKYAWEYYLEDFSDNFHSFYHSNKAAGLSIRCLKDNNSGF